MESQRKPAPPLQNCKDGPPKSFLQLQRSATCPPLARPISKTEKFPLPASPAFAKLQAIVKYPEGKIAVALLAVALLFAFSLQADAQKPNELETRIVETAKNVEYAVMAMMYWGPHAKQR